MIRASGSGLASQRVPREIASATLDSRVSVTASAVAGKVVGGCGLRMRVLGQAARSLLQPLPRHPHRLHRLPDPRLTRPRWTAGAAGAESVI